MSYRFVFYMQSNENILYLT